MAAGRLYDHLDQEETWTLDVRPSTGDGGCEVRINIGTHEVAWLHLIEGDEVEVGLIVDPHILGFRDTVFWCLDRKGRLQKAIYRDVGPRTIYLRFQDSYADAKLVFDQPGICDAMGALWGRRLVEEGARKSQHARSHSPAAVAELLAYKQSLTA
jgi:hypothetical protein